MNAREPVMAAAMGAALLAVGLPGGSGDDDEFIARGEQRAVTTAQTADGVEISASCAGAEKSITCNAKDELLLDVDVREHRRQLGVLLFSQVSKDEGKITWFFPKAGEAAPVVEGGSTLQKLTLSAPQGQGHYLMVVVDKEVSRKDVLSKVQQVLEKAEAADAQPLLWRAAAGGAACMLARGQLDSAEQALSRTMQEAERAESHVAFAAALTTWAETLRHQGRYSEALSQLYRRLPMASQRQDPGPYVRMLLATAWLELDLSRLGRAQECTDTLAATIHRGELLHIRLEAQLLNGRILLASGQYRRASYVLQEVHDSAKKAELTVLRERARAVLAETLYALGDREAGRSLFQSAVLGMLGTGDLTMLAEAVRGRARVEAVTRDPSDIFKPVARLLDEQPVALLRLEQLLARAAWHRHHGEKPAAHQCHREAAMVLNRVATQLNDTDRAALRVHPWSTWIRRGLTSRSSTGGRGKGAG